MATGACGICCDVCRLNVRGLCTTCGPGTSPEALQKLEAQHRIFHGYCPILKCAHDHQIAHCPRDCRNFPCETFQQGPYPFSQRFLDMQKRRRDQTRRPVPSLAEMAGWRQEELDPSYWEELRASKPEEVCARTLATYDPGKRFYRLTMLNESYRIYPHSGSVEPDGEPSSPRDPFLCSEISFSEALILVVYLLRAREVSPAGRLVTERELPGGETFFRGPHELSRRPILDRFRTDPSGFLRAGNTLGAVRTSFGDASFRLQALPRVALDYILWVEDDEFPARLTIGFDPTVAEHLPLDVIWALVELATNWIAQAAATDS